MRYEVGDFEGAKVGKNFVRDTDFGKARME